MTIPSLKDLIDRISNDIVSRSEDRAVYVRFSLPWILSRVVAAAIHDLYQAGKNYINQIVPLTATDEWLSAWANTFGIERKLAQKAWGCIKVYGSSGAVVPAGAEISDKLGHIWKTQCSATIPSSGEVLIPVIAEKGGSSHNVDGLAELFFVNPPQNVAVSVITLGDYGISGGSTTNKASGYVRVTGTSGAVLPSGIRIYRYDGLEYQTTDTVTWTSDCDMPVFVQASNFGAQYNTNPLEILEISSAPVGITPECEVMNSGIYGGVDDETDTELRMRLLQFLRERPHGGTLPDIVQWCYDFRRLKIYRAYAFAYPILPPGLVHVYCVLDNEYPFLNAEQISLLEGYLSGLKPAGIQIEVRTPAPYPTNVEIANLTVEYGYSINTVKSEIEKALKRMALNFTVIHNESYIYLADIYTTIGSVDGVKHFRLNYPVTDMVVNPYSLPSVSVTWL